MHRIYIAFIIALLFTLGCSNVTKTPSTPDMDSGKTPSGGNSHALWGLWQGVINPEAQTVELTPLRRAEMHVNVLPFLEPPAMVNLTLDSIEWNGNIIEADIGLRHPFLGLTEFTGFDVCGIFISNGSISGFDDADLEMAGGGDTRLLNPDGYSRWWNPAEFPVNEGTMFSYNDGLLGAPDAFADYSATLNGYKYYCDDLDADDPLDTLILASRGMFTPGQKNVRHYTIELGGDGLVFNYAIDACWQFPSGGPPWTAPQDFGPGANRAEAWWIDYTETTNTLWNDGSENGGDLSLSIDVYDWFNPDMNTVRVESPGNFAIITATTPNGGGTGYSTYDIDITDATPAENSIDLLISVECEVIGYGGLLPGEPVTVYFTTTIDIADEAPLVNGWARTWGGTSGDRTFGIDVDSSGNSYITGFDEMGSSASDVFLRKYDAEGNLAWGKSWGGGQGDRGYDVELDGSGNLYVTGHFGLTVDFDPDTGVDNHTTNGGPDIFLSKFDTDGDFIWALTWGGTPNYADTGNAVAVDGSGNIYVTGRYVGVNVDFDPGGGTDYHTSTAADFYLTKFDSAGNHQWAISWGGSWDDDVGFDIEAFGSGVYVTGYYRATADFDPGPGVDNHTSVYGRDVFICKYNVDGDYQWGKTWGGSSSFDEGYGVAVDSSGNIYVTGRWEYTIDFDPGNGVDNKTANGHFDVFLSKFDSSGSYLGVTVWGGTSYEICNDVDVDGNDNVLIAGYWRGTDVDFDPGPGTDNRTSTMDSFGYPSVDAFLCKYDSSVDYVWARTWGGESSDEGHRVAADAAGNSWIGGSFFMSADFAPTDAPCNEPPDILASNGDFDAFLAKYLPDGCWQ